GRSGGDQAREVVYRATRTAPWTALAAFLVAFLLGRGDGRVTMGVIWLCLLVSLLLVSGLATVLVRHRVRTGTPCWRGRVRGDRRRVIFPDPHTPGRVVVGTLGTGPAGADCPEVTVHTGLFSYLCDFGWAQRDGDRTVYPVPRWGRFCEAAGLALAARAPRPG